MSEQEIKLEKITGAINRLTIDTQPMNDAVSELIAVVSEIFTAYVQAIVEAFAINSEEFHREVRILSAFVHPEHIEGESLVDWGQRLDDAELFDIEEVRWMYRIECVRSIYLFLYRMVVQRG